jgi:hypothetical protein
MNSKSKGFYQVDEKITFCRSREYEQTMGEYLLHGEFQRLVLPRHERVAVDNVKCFRRGLVGAVCAVVHDKNLLCFFKFWDCVYLCEKPFGGDVRPQRGLKFGVEIAGCLCYIIYRLQQQKPPDETRRTRHDDDAGKGRIVMSMAIQIISSVAVLAGFILLQWNILKPKSAAYLLVNAVGSGLLAADAVIEAQ